MNSELDFYIGFFKEHGFKNKVWYYIWFKCLHARV